MTKTNYSEHMLDISDNKKEKITLAMKNDEPVKIRISNIGDDKIALTESQINKINNAFQKNKTVDIKLGKAQLKYNKDKVEGGFLGALLARLAPVAAKVLPQVAKHLGIGALTGLASSAVSKILGNGIYLKRNGNVVKIKDYGNGLVLKPETTNELDKVGDGLFIKKDNELFDGSGIMHDIVKDIPLLNILF